MSHPGLRSTASRPGRTSKGGLAPARPLSDLVSKYETLSTGGKRPVLLSEVKLRPINPRGGGPQRHQNAVSLYPKSARVAQTVRAETTKTPRLVSNQEKKTQLQIRSADAAFRLQSHIQDVVPEISRTTAAPTSVSERRKAFEALRGVDRCRFIFRSISKIDANIRQLGQIIREQRTMSQRSSTALNGRQQGKQSQ